MLESGGTSAGQWVSGRSLTMEIPQAALALLTVLSSLLDAIKELLELPATVFHGYSSLVRSGVDAVRSLYESYGYWVIFFGTLFENTLFLGLIVPGAVVVILAGLSAHDGTISVPLAILLGTLGTMIGDTISYCLGRFGWSRLSRLTFMRDLETKVREPLLRRGVFFVLFYHFAGYTRVVGPAAAGFFKMPFKEWAPADYLGALLWVSGYLTLGYELGALGLTFDSSDRWFRYIEWGLLVIALVVGYKMFQASQKTWSVYQKPRREAPVLQPEVTAEHEIRHDDPESAGVGAFRD
jgi:membrane-associated protein